MTSICFLDTETTGLHPEREIWEIAAVKRDPNGTETPLLLQIDPVDLSKADPMGLRIGGFFDRHVRHGEPNFNQPSILSAVNKSTAAQILSAFIHNSHIVGAVPNFDTESLDKLFRTNGLLPMWHYHLIDVETLAVGYLKGVRATLNWRGNQTELIDLDYDFTLPWKSDDLSRAIGVEPPTDEERHTAMGDVKWVMRTYDRVMGVS